MLGGFGKGCETKFVDTAEGRKAFLRLPLSCCVGMQQEVAGRIAAATIVICGDVAGRY